MSMSATANADGRTVRGGASIGLHDQEVGIAELGIELAEPIGLRYGRMLRGALPLRPGRAPQRLSRGMREIAI